MTENQCIEAFAIIRKHKLDAEIYNVMDELYEQIIKES